MSEQNRKEGRFEAVSRRTLLKATTGFGIAALLPAACGNNDQDALEGALTELVTGNNSAVPTTAPVTLPSAATDEPVPATQAPTAEPAEAPTAETPESTAEPAVEPSDVPTTEVAEAPTAVPTAEPAIVATLAGSLITNFTYTQSVGGKNENPYVAVWIENTSGDLVQTVALFYDRVHRKGAVWLDHLLQWWDTDQARIRAGGTNTVTTISSATRAPGEYTVQWDGTAGGVAAPAGNYVFCIEAAREEGPYSLIVQPLTLTAQGASYQLTGNGELSNASVQTSA